MGLRQLHRNCGLLAEKKNRRGFCGMSAVVCELWAEIPNGSWVMKEVKEMGSRRGGDGGGRGRVRVEREG